MKSNLVDKIVFVRNGIDEVRRKATMQIDMDNNGRSFLDASPAHLVGFKKEYLIIETVLLSDVVNAAVHHENPSHLIMKMDIEMFECRAILGNHFRAGCCMCGCIFMVHCCKHVNMYIAFSLQVQNPCFKP